MSPDKGWFQRQMARTQADVKELPDWLRHPARPSDRLLTTWEAQLETTLAARDAALQACQEELVKLRAYFEGTEAALETLEAEWADRVARLRATLPDQAKEPSA